MTGPSMTDNLYTIGPERTPERERQKALDSLLLLEVWLSIRGIRVLEYEPVHSLASNIAYNCLTQRWALYAWFVNGK